MAGLMVVGGGRMGSALVGGLLASGWAAGEVVVADPLAGARRSLTKRWPGIGAVDSPGDPRAEGCESAVLAVKPADCERACAAVAPLGVGRVLSIVAGVPISALERWLGPGTAVVRAMPNTAAQVRAGASAIAAGTRAGEDTMAWAEHLLGAVGSVVRVAEPLLDTVTGLSGSGPAYVFLLAEALVDAGVRNGLPEAASRALSYQTIAGSAKVLIETGQPPEALREAVTSPGGTTAAGLAVLRSRSVSEAVVAAVTAATERSRELAGPPDG